MAHGPQLAIRERPADLLKWFVGSRGAGIASEVSPSRPPERTPLSSRSTFHRGSLISPANLTSPMGVTTPLPSPDAIARAELLTRERFVYEGESLEEALAPGSPRRRALDAALAEVAEGRRSPSIEWRREFGLLLGLERLLSEEEPHLADGTVLSAHQVDALSGTLTALLAEAQRQADGNGAAAAEREAQERDDGEDG